MGRPIGSTGKKNRKWTLDEKLRIVKRVLDSKESIRSVSKDELISSGLLTTWVSKYQKGGSEELGADGRGRTGKYSRKKNMTRKEQLEYENLLLKIENERLKKGYQVRGGGRNKEYASINNKNSKSLKN